VGSRPHEGDLKTRGLALLTALVLTACNAPAELPLVKPSTPKSLSVFAGANAEGTIYFAHGNRIWKLRGNRLSAVTPAGQQYSHPAASSDGLVTAAAVLGKGHSEIAVGNTDFGGLTALTKVLPDPRKDSLDLRPAFSPDGKRLAFISDRAKDYRDEAVWEGTYRPYKPTQVSCPLDYTGGDDAPVYTPDGAGLIFVTWVGGHAQLDQVTIPPRGACAYSKPKKLLALDGGDILDPDVANDGRLAYAQRNGDASDIYVAAANGSGPAKVTSFGDARQPAWSVDGKSLLFISPRGGTFDLWSVAVGTGAEAKRLTWGGDLDATSRPAWIK
jgi:Tol biopolymer transport system component